MNTAGAQLYNLYKSMQGMAILLKATYLLRAKRRWSMGGSLKRANTTMFTILLDEKKKIKRNDEDDDDG